MNRNNRGKFTVSGEIIRYDFPTLVRIMKDVVVLRVETRLDRDETDFYAYHPSFEESDYRCVADEYEPIISKKINGEITSVEWRKK